MKGETDKTILLYDIEAITIGFPKQCCNKTKHILNKIILFKKVHGVQVTCERAFCQI